MVVLGLVMHAVRGSTRNLSLTEMPIDRIIGKLRATIAPTGLVDVSLPNLSP
jgi:hypothetical protein